MRVISAFVLFGTVVIGTSGRPDGSYIVEPLTVKPLIEQDVCETRECKDLADEIGGSMNRNADPCENFLDYMCGNSNKSLPEHEIPWNTFGIQVEDLLETILREEIKPEDFHSMRIAKRAFQACMNTDEMEKFGLQPLISTLWRAGGWPLIMEEGEWDEYMYKWQKVDDYYAHLTGLNSFFDVHVDINNWDLGHVNLIIDTPQIPPNTMYKIPSIKTVMNKYKQSLPNKRIFENKARKRSSKYKRMSKPGSVKKSRKLKNDEKNKEINYDFFFNDSDNEGVRNNDNKIEGNVNGNNDENDEENGNISDNENDNDDYELYDKKSSGSGDHEWYIYFVSGSGDHELYDYDGSGSGDHELYDYDGSGDHELYDYDGSGNHELYDYDGSGSGDHELYDYDTNNAYMKWLEEIFLYTRTQYLVHMLNVTIALSEARGVPISIERLRKDAIDLIGFQLDLKELVLKYGKSIKISLEEFQALYDSMEPRTSNGKINWIKKVQDHFANGGMEIDRKTTVLISNPRYTLSLQELLDITPSRTIVNYIHWNFVSRAIKATTKEMRTLHYNWHDVEPETVNRTRECVREIQAEFLVGYEYIRRYFPETTLEQFYGVIDDIQAILGSALRPNRDMIERVILHKLESMKSVTGYPDLYRNTYVAKDFYKGLSVSNIHYENVLSTMRYFKYQNLNVLFTGEIPEEVRIDLSAVHTFFGIEGIDVGKPVFTPYQPMYRNYAIIGRLMYRHDCITMGNLYNKREEPTWWKVLIKEANHITCFIDTPPQYFIEKDYIRDDYFDLDMKGLKIIFSIYKQLKLFGPYYELDTALPGLEYLSDEQLFFLFFGIRKYESLLVEIISSSVEGFASLGGCDPYMFEASWNDEFDNAFKCSSNFTID